MPSNFVQVKDRLANPVPIHTAAGPRRNLPIGKEGNHFQASTRG